MKNLLFRIIRIIEILGVKNFHKYVLDFKNLSISSTKIADKILKYVPDIKSIIDIGANRGQFLFAINKAYPDAQIYSFEPLPSMFEILKERTKEIENISINNLAISKTEGEISFYKGEYSHISSALKIDNANHNPKYSNAEITELKVPSIPLSTFFKNKNLEKPVLLKIDAQGLEKEILDSLGNFKSEIDFIVLELAFIKLYENQPLFSEVNQLLNQMGFTIVAPVDFNLGLEDKIIEMDFLYKKNI